MNLSHYKNLKPRQKIFILSAVFLLIYTLIILLVFAPSINKIKELKEIIISQKTEMKKNLDQANNLAILGQKIEKIKPEMEKFDQIFINQNRELEFITTLEEIAQKNSIDQKIDLEPQNSKNKFKESPLAISASGSFTNIMKYLTELESLKYYINMENIEINTTASASRGRETAGANINLNIQAKTYWQ